ncbi:MAG: glycosyltransferase family 2 protein [Candidatus Nanoarchaeia archaeon]|nr:glycosyltransferase family 2 protein [Candidatus Nanoarchaeia archaeon]MDD5741426.1 glycosyltransferase family 2 protein [Candidatus Nanoarchaeia archaeon]
MINIIITSYGESKSTAKAVKCFLDRDIKEKFRIIVVDPFPEVKDYLKQHINNENVGFFLDPGEGKSYALNLLFEKLYSNNKEDIFVLSDGDVYVSPNALDEILNAFKDMEVGCVTGRPVSLNSRDNFFGYASHVAFDGIHKTRLRLSEEKKFFECSGYLFAIRNSVLHGFPLEASEDSIIPYLFWKQGYRIKYLPKAEVYVINPQNWKDFKIQKIRNIKGHENLSKIALDIPRTKTLWNEIKEGFFFALFYPRNLKEVFYTIPLFATRLYIYLKAFYELKFKKNSYEDGWRKNQTESTKPMD